MKTILSWLNSILLWLAIIGTFYLFNRYVSYNEMVTDTLANAINQIAARVGRT